MRSIIKQGDPDSDVIINMFCTKFKLSVEFCNTFDFLCGFPDKLLLSEGFKYC